MQLMEAASRLFRDRDGAYRGAVANAILDLDSDSAAALAVLLDKQQEDALEAALERRAAADMRVAAERVAAAEGAAAGTAAGAAAFPPGPFTEKAHWEMLMCNGVLETAIPDIEYVPALLMAKGITSPRQIGDMDAKDAVKLLRCVPEAAAEIQQRCKYYSISP